MKTKIIILSIFIGVVLNFSNPTILQFLLGSVSMTVFIFLTLSMLFAVTTRIKSKKFLGASIKIVTMTITLMIVFILFTAFHPTIDCNTSLYRFNQNIVTGSCSFKADCTNPWYKRPGCAKSAEEKLEIMYDVLDQDMLTQKCNELCTDDKETFCGDFIPNIASDMSCDDITDCDC